MRGTLHRLRHPLRRPVNGGTGDELVSIVIPCFNQARFLGDAIESALAQTYPALEILVLNDGSSDGTPEVAERYGVRCVTQPNQGLSAARNRGLAETSGSLITFLDADDRLRPPAIALGIESLREHAECAFTSGFCSLVGPDGSTLFEPEQLHIERDHYAALLRHNYIWCPASVLYRRSALEAVGFFESAFDAAADYHIYLRIARDHPLTSHTAVVAEYRQHSSNMSNDSELMFETVRAVLRSQREYVRGRPELEQAYESGMQLYSDFYDDPWLRELREHYRTRMREIEAILHEPVDRVERDALVRELRRLYQWILETFRLKRTVASLAAQLAEVREENRQPELPVESQEGANGS
jgi:glycosyltransferase involved in cell wall biosynthesis